MLNQKSGKEAHKKKKIQLDIRVIAILLYLLFRIPLANILGDDGNGYLSIAWEVYIFFSLFFVYGCSKVISQMIKMRVTKNQYRNGRRVLKVGICFGVLICVLEAGILYVASNWLSQNLFYQKLAGIGIRFFAILLIINVLVRVFRGYFEGMGTMVPTHISFFIEAFVTATGAFLFVGIANNYGEKVSRLLINPQFQPAMRAAGVVVSYLCGSLFAVLFLLFVYGMYQGYFQELLKKDETKFQEPLGRVIKEMILGIMKVTIPGSIFILYRIINLLLFSRTYLSGEETLLYGRLIGSYYGKITVLMAFFIVVILSITNGSQKRMRRYFSKREYKNGKQYLLEEVKKLLIGGGIVLILFAVFGPQIMQFLFQTVGQTEGKMSRICGATVLCITVGVYLYHIMKYMKLEHFLFFLSVIALMLQTVVVIFSMKVPAIGALSMMIGELVFWIVIIIGEGILLINNLSVDIRKKPLE